MPQQRDAKKTCGLLLGLKGFRKLDLCIDEDRYEFRTRRGDFRLRGLQSLEGLRGLNEVNFHGTCPTIKAMLKPKLTAMLSSVEDRVSVKDDKRKAEEALEVPKQKRVRRKRLMVAW